MYANINYFYLVKISAYPSSSVKRVLKVIGTGPHLRGSTFLNLAPIQLMILLAVKPG